MFERYTELARRTIFFARYEASQFGSPTIETEHLLLGVLRADRDLALRLLGSSTAIEAVRKQVEARAARGPTIQTSVDLPLSAASRNALVRAAELAEHLGHKYIEAGHLLLALLGEKDSLVVEVLASQGVDEQAVKDALAHPEEASSAQPWSHEEDGAVVTERHLVHRGHRLALVERLRLSQDGRTLSYSLEITGPDGQPRHASFDFDVSGAGSPGDSSS